jgi:Sulfatase-modifying factor enzyme 1
MRWFACLALGPTVALTLAVGTGSDAATLKCPPDSVKVGTLCVDKYEDSVWAIDPTNKKLVKKVLAGKATATDLQSGGASELAPAGSCTGSVSYGATFPATGNWIPIPDSSPPSPGIYAASIANVLPSACITWFQANQACALVGKRLLRNDEWQRAAAGTPDLPGRCNVNQLEPLPTGSLFSFPRSQCVSSWGVADMVGNVEEWVADWADLSKGGCTDSTVSFGFPGTGDRMCFGGDGSIQTPGAMLRGGDWAHSNTGIFDMSTGFPPSESLTTVGFRCAR